MISKAVVEEFAPGFLEQPSVIWLSESRNQVVARDDRLAKAIGLAIDPGRNLPDLILVDIGPKNPLLVFVEVVATDGSVNETRRVALMGIANKAGGHCRGGSGFAAQTPSLPPRRGALPTVAVVLGHAHLTTTMSGAEARELIACVWD